MLRLLCQFGIGIALPLTQLVAVPLPIGESMNRKGFTLIELLIVVVIIGILAAIAIPKFANTKEKAYVAAMKSDLRNLVTAQESYFADNVTYPSTTTNLSYNSSTGVTVAVGDVQIAVFHVATTSLGAAAGMSTPYHALNA